MHFHNNLASSASAFWAAYLKARKTMPRAFKGIIYRLLIFFVLGSISVGVLLKHDDTTFVTAITEGVAGANVSPYVHN